MNGELSIQYMFHDARDLGIFIFLFYGKQKYIEGGFPPAWRDGKWNLHGIISILS